MVGILLVTHLTLLVALVDHILLLLLLLVRLRILLLLLLHVTLIGDRVVRLRRRGGLLRVR